MPQVVLNNLYAHTQLQDTLRRRSCSAIDGGQPRVLNLKEMLERFISHRRDVVTRRDPLRAAQGQASASTSSSATRSRSTTSTRSSRSSAPATTARWRASRCRASSASPRSRPRRSWRCSCSGSPASSDRRFSDELAEVQHHHRRSRQILAETACCGDQGRAARGAGGFADRAAPRCSEADRPLRRGPDRRGGHGGHRQPRRVRQAQPGLALPRAEARRPRQDRGAGPRTRTSSGDLFVAITHSYVWLFTNQGRVTGSRCTRSRRRAAAARGKPIINLVQLAQGEKVAAILPVRTLPDLGQGAEEAPEVDVAEGPGPTPAGQEGDPRTSSWRPARA